MSSCGLFDKEINQDKHIAAFRYQMSRVKDSLDTHKERVKAFETIIANINEDKALITPRKKNMLLMDGNAYISNEYLLMKEYPKAIVYTNMIINLDSASARGYYSRGCIYQKLKRDSLAVKDYNKALSLNPDYTDAYYNRGIIYEKNKKYDEALDDYNKAIKGNPAYIADVYNNRGNIYLAKESYDKAVDDYSKAISIDTASINAYRNRAEAYIKQDLLDKALVDYSKAISLDSMSITPFLKRAGIHELNEEYEEALKDYKKVIALDPHNAAEANEIAREAIKKIKPLIKKRKAD
jgi:tetratricopeptide (TPR) repeat protein